MKNLHDSVLHPSYWKCLEHYSKSPSELVHTAFVELSTANLSKKIQCFVIFSSRDTCRTKASSKHFPYNGTLRYFEYKKNY